MVDFVDFDPEKHKGRQLYELQSREMGEIIATVPVPVDTPFDQAAQTPWYYVVEAQEGD